MHRAWLMVIVALFPLRAFAQDSEKLLEQAEDAFVNIELAEAARLAEEAIKAGTFRAPNRLARAYFLAGVNQAKEGDEKEAYARYRKGLILWPEMELDTSLGPDLQSPFLRARGDLKARSVVLSISTRLTEGPAGPVVSVEVRDIGELIDRLVVHVRPVYFDKERESAFNQVEQKVSGSDVAIAMGSFGLRDFSEIESEIASFDVAVTALDAFGNVVREDQRVDEPHRFKNPYFREPTGFEELIASPFFWLASGAVVAAAGVLVYGFVIADPNREGVVRVDRP